MNELFQQYKASVECEVKFVDDLKTRFSVASAIIVSAEMEKGYNRAREKREWKREIEEER